jgi:fructose-bisphosphate aldolase class 1
MSMHFWYDPEKQQYVEVTEDLAWELENGKRKSMDEPTYDGSTKAEQKLEDIGTRFNHLNDFLDFLTDGVLSVSNSLARYANDTDTRRLANLKAAVVLMEAYQNKLAKVEFYKWDFNKQLDECKSDQVVIAQIRQERIDKAKQAKAEDKPYLPENDDTVGA